MSKENIPRTPGEEPGYLPPGNTYDAGHSINRQPDMLDLSALNEESRRFVEKLIIDREKLKYFLEGAGAGTWEWHIQTGIEKIDEKCAAFAGYTLEEIEEYFGGSMDAITDPESLRLSDTLLQRCIDGETDQYTGILKIRHKNGSRIWTEDKGKVLERDDEGRPLTMYGTSIDVTEREEMKAELKRKALHDSLTGLYSNYYLEEQIDVLQNSRQFPVSVIYIDVDRLKDTNDNFGHDEGDRMLKRLAEVLKTVFRRTEDCVVRKGGDEFVILLPEANEESANDITKKIRTTLDEHNHKFQNMPLSVSAGYSTAKSGESIRRAITKADKGMLKIKDMKKRLPAYEL
jgi:diguanylate cyclase (GGDEF)-like protein/PAS domain S-box-containing protein